MRVDPANITLTIKILFFFSSIPNQNKKQWDQLICEYGFDSFRYYQIGTNTKPFYIILYRQTYIISTYLHKIAIESTKLSYSLYFHQRNQSKLGIYNNNAADLRLVPIIYIIIYNGQTS